MLESRAREVQINDVRRSIFLAFLEYLYTDNVNIPVETAMELFVAADRVRMLVSVCIHMIST